MTGSCRDALAQPLQLPELDLFAIQEKNPVFCLNFYRRPSLLDKRVSKLLSAKSVFRFQKRGPGIGSVHRGLGTAIVYVCV